MLLYLHVSGPFFDDLFNLGAALGRGDVFLQRKNVWDGLDSIQINTDDNSLGRHIFSGDLKPAHKKVRNPIFEEWITIVWFAT